MDEQYHFEFNQWQEAFEMFYRKRFGYEVKNERGNVIGRVKGNPQIVLVISTACYVSGYWIEKGEGAKTDKHTKVY